jgi:N-acetyl-anhydromuramyl-L-alanine amidase AmpD
MRKESLEMNIQRRSRWWSLCTLIVLPLAFGWGAPLAAAPSTPAVSPGPAAQTRPDALQEAFRAAASEFAVPESVLLAVSYHLSRWEQNQGAPSVAGGYGPMHLTDVDRLPLFDGRGDDRTRPRTPTRNDPGLHTLDTAAALLGIDAETLKRDPAQNIRGGAALLARYARETGGPGVANVGDWYGAVAKYNGSPDPVAAGSFADDVYATIQAGMARTTSDGQRVVLTAQTVAPNRATAAGLDSHRRRDTECPTRLDCDFVPAAYVLNDPNDLTNYGNYDLADREDDGLDIRYIVIHNTEIDYATTLQAFQNPLRYVSAHYVIRSSDGHIAQMVRNQNVAWHAGNWYVNGHAIGLEHEGVAIEGATWYTEQMYRASARLARYLAQKYHIPLDRAHIIGHDEIPGPTPPFQAGMHWDPGPFWDWAHYMELVGAPLTHRSHARRSPIVTIAPNFETNLQPMTYCYNAEIDDCRAVPLQPSNFVYLRSAPDPSAPLISNPYVGSDPTRANNWANKALTGQRFYRVERQGNWDAIYFSGQKAWFYNPNGTNAVPGSGRLITPKAGRASVPVYGRAYPEEAAYPPGITPQAITSIYDLPAGQIYVAADRVRSAYYSAPTYAPTLEESDHVVVRGRTRYYQIFFNHRFGFVKAEDVDIIRAP